MNNGQKTLGFFLATVATEAYTAYHVVPPHQDGPRAIVGGVVAISFAIAAIWMGGRGPSRPDAQSIESGNSLEP